MSMEIASTIKSTRRWPPALIGLLLLVLGFAVWTLFSLLPALGHGPSSRVREAWDTPAFWYAGATAMLAGQLVGGVVMGGSLFRQPLWSLVGLFAGIVAVHPAGGSYDQLPLALILIGAPGYVALLAAAAAGRKLGDCLED
jgi:hypothetical protein